MPTALSYTVTYWEAFTVEGGTVTFCVRHWPATLPWPARYELSVHCHLGSTTGGLSEAASVLRRPALLWDVAGSVPFSWTPPAPLPATEGTQQVDFKGCRVVSQFSVAPQFWKLTLMWLSPSQAASQPVPTRIVAQIQNHDGRRILHPSSGKSFQIPLLGSPEPPRAGPQMPVDLRADVAMQELNEARHDLEQLRLRQEQFQATLAQRKSEKMEIERQVKELPSPEWHADIQSRLEEETAHRQRCQTEHLDLRGRPRLFCVLQSGVEPGAEQSVIAQSQKLELDRVEVSVPSLQHNFDFDFVLKDGNGTNCEELWSEAKPLLDSALCSSASYACVILAAGAGQSDEARRDLKTRMIERLFAFVGDVPLRGECTLEAAVAMVEVAQDNTGFYNLLQEDPTKQSVAPRLVDSGPDNAIPVHDISIVLARTSKEVLAVQSSGATRLSKQRGHSVLSISVQRRCSLTQELACVARLAIVEVGSLPESCTAPSTSEHASSTTGGKPSCVKQLSMMTRTAQACIDHTCNASGGGRHANLATPSVSAQAKIFLIAFVSPHLQHIQDSVSILQLAAAAVSVQERSSSKPDDISCRRQFAKLMQENTRLRAEIAERGRVPAQADAVDFEQQEAVCQDAEMAPQAVTKTSSGTPNMRSPRSHVAFGSSSAHRCWGTREHRTPEHRRRTCGITPCLLPSR